MKNVQFLRKLLPVNSEVLVHLKILKALRLYEWFLFVHKLNITNKN
jgi:hypothetical protein